MFRFNTAALRFNSKQMLLRSFSDSRKVLPPELSRNTVRLTCKSTAKGRICDVYVVGTIHESPKSCEEVKAIVNYLKPHVWYFKVVFLELCSNRACLLGRDFPNNAWDYWDVKKKDVYDILGLDIVLYMIHLGTCQQCYCKHNSVVAVVGISHLAGIGKYWKQPVKVEQLLSVP